MAGINLREQSMDLTVKVLKLCEGISAHRSLVIRLEQAVTDIGANIHEASYIYGTEQVSCLQAAMKYCYETEYWLELMQKSQIFTNEIVKSLLHDCGAIRRILISSINTTKSNM